MGNDNASSALKFAVGLVVTMILIGIIIVAFSFARNHANSAISNTSKDVSQIEDSRYTMYDGSTITGAEVINLIKKFENDDICISVDNAAHTRAAVSAFTTTNVGSVFYIKASMGAAGKQTTAELAEALRKAKDTSDTTYINPSSEYYGIVNYDSTTAALQGISFFRVEG